MKADVAENEVTKTVTVTEKVITLELTEDEAAILCAVVSRIAGWNPSSAVPNPRRDLTDELCRALTACGYGERNETYEAHRLVLGSGEYYFSSGR